MKLEFTKMHGCGNDYIFIDCFEHEAENLPALSVRLSDRHFGIGGDGIVLLSRSAGADAEMRMFNSDGSEGRMCGNALRCSAKFLYDSGLVKKTQMNIDTLSGIKEVTLIFDGSEVAAAKADMGKALFVPELIPVNFEGESVISRELSFGEYKFSVTCVSMGNPHAVIFCSDPEDIRLHEIGPLIESDEIFPEKTNTEFVQVIDCRTLKMRVWERGSGETLACGTGACAAAAAAVMNGYCTEGEDISVILPGGELIINYTQDTVFMTGECVRVFDGTVLI